MSDSQGTENLLPHQVRVIAEKVDLDEKLRKLSTFINSDSFAATVSDEDERARLICQEEIMRDYSDILHERIQAFGVALSPVAPDDAEAPAHSHQGLRG